MERNYTNYNPMIEEEPEPIIDLLQINYKITKVTKSKFNLYENLKNKRTYLYRYLNKNSQSIYKNDIFTDIFNIVCMSEIWNLWRNYYIRSFLKQISKYLDTY